MEVILVICNDLKKVRQKKKVGTFYILSSITINKVKNRHVEPAEIHEKYYIIFLRKARALNLAMISELWLLGKIKNTIGAAKGRNG